MTVMNGKNTPMNKNVLYHPLVFLGRHPESRWIIGWLLGIALLGFWDMLFLNRPALALLMEACVHSLIIATGSVILAGASGWLLAMGHYYFRKRPVPAQMLNGLVALLRSVPQVITLIAGYTLLTWMMEREALTQPAGLLALTAVLYAAVTALEFRDLFIQRIALFERSDFIRASLVCGLSEYRVINRDILWHNSKAHLINKTISLGGAVLFLQCSFDFILSVGLSSQVSAANFPVTIGSLLTRMDSKKDILAFGASWTDPSYWPRLLTDHLQGLSLAILLILTLTCLYKFTEEFALRRKL